MQLYNNIICLKFQEGIRLFLLIFTTFCFIFIPYRVHFGNSCIFRAFSLIKQLVFYKLKARNELVGRVAERPFGLHSELTAKGSSCQKQIGGAKLFLLIIELQKYRIGVGKIKAFCLLPHLFGTHKRRVLLRHRSEL